MSKEGLLVKIINFGLAWKHFANVVLPITTFMFTPYYIAPKVPQKRYDKTCDLWLADVTAYIILYGYPHSMKRTTRRSMNQFEVIGIASLH